jgi:Flp pilus assembly protein TadD
VRLDGETQPRIRTLRAGEGFLSQSSKTLHFGLGNASSPPRVVVHWPGGTAESFSGVEPDGRYRLVQGTGRAEPWGTAPRAQPLHPAILVEPKGTERLRVLSASQLPLPRLEYTTFDGAPRIVGEGTRRGPVLLHLWSRGCATCLQELQTWKREAEAFRSAGIDVISLSVDGLTAAASLDPTQAATNASDSKLQAERDAIRETVERLAIPYTSGMATPATAETIRLVLEHLFDLHTPLTVPLSILISPQGTLLALYRGNTEIQTIQNDTVMSLSSEQSLASAVPFQGKWFQHRKRQSPFELAWKLISSGQLKIGVDYIKANQKALEADTDFPKLLSLVGTMRLQQGDLEAANDFQEAIRRNPEEAIVHYNLGLAMQSRGRIPEAIEAYQKALAIDDNHSQAHNNLAIALISQGKMETAIEHLRRVVEIQPDYAEGQFNLGNALFTSGNVDASIVHFRRAVELRPDYAKAHNNLAVALKKSGKSDEAYRHMQEAQRLKRAAGKP